MGRRSLAVSLFYTSNLEIEEARLPSILRPTCSPATRHQDGHLTLWPRNTAGSRLDSGSVIPAPSEFAGAGFVDAERLTWSIRTTQKQGSSGPSRVITDLP